MRRLTGQRALVTGASGGVGRAIAIRLAERGVDCALFARREAELEATAQAVRALGQEAIPVAGDVTSAVDRDRALASCADLLGGLDLLVNNAGVGAHGKFHESTPDALETLMRVNLHAAVELTREALPLLQGSKTACVANIGSILGWRGAPWVAEYCASKFALRGWNEAIRPEFAKLGIHVLHASPSTIQSEFRSNLVRSDSQIPWGKRRGVTPEQVAARVVRGVERRQNEVAIVWEDWAFVRAARFAPWILDRVMNRLA